ncbi:STAS domain-containing protein [Chitinimonas lacunae]|uniref:STAS domain-containing protein n=1 Tax=Chitinimonas lacunae TaxID=1963018 RepID=A0ABV8MQQ2_9NEIS
MGPIVKIHGETGRLIVLGQFDVNLYRAFRGSSQQLLDNATVREILIDLEQVHSMDSSAIGMMLLLQERASLSDKSMYLINCRDAVRQTLAGSGAGRHFKFRH